MMKFIQNISIKKYKNLENLEFNNFSKFNFITGIGKTSLLEQLHIACHSNIPSINYINGYEFFHNKVIDEWTYKYGIGEFTVNGISFKIDEHDSLLGEYTEIMSSEIGQKEEKYLMDIKCCEKDREEANVLAGVKVYRNEDLINVNDRTFILDSYSLNHNLKAHVVSKDFTAKHYINLLGHCIHYNEIEDELLLLINTFFPNIIRINFNIGNVIKVLFKNNDLYSHISCLNESKIKIINLFMAIASKRYNIIMMEDIQVYNKLELLKLFDILKDVKDIQFFFTSNSDIYKEVFPYVRYGEVSEIKLQK